MYGGPAFKGTVVSLRSSLRINKPLLWYSMSSVCEPDELCFKSCKAVLQHPSTETCLQFPVKFPFYGITRSLSVSLCASLFRETNMINAFLLLCLLALVRWWRGGMFSIWSPWRRRSPIPKSRAGPSMQQDTMFTTGTVITPHTQLGVIQLYLCWH